MKVLDQIRIVQVSETSTSLFLGEHISSINNELLKRAQTFLINLKIAGVQEIVLCYHSLTIFYDPWIIFNKGVIPNKYIKEHLESIPWNELVASLKETKTNAIVLPVNYGSEDLEILEGLLKLNKKEIIEIHTSIDYQVFMIGFLPGFPYMGVLPEPLHVQRKPSPSPKIEAGSVSIAGSQTGIYSFDSPGGWYVLGHTSEIMFDINRNPRLRFTAGDRVRFRSI